MQTLEINQVAISVVIEQAVAVLRAGGLIIFPTETTYGAGVDATNPKAVAKLLAYKSRREGKPLSIAVTDLAMAQRYVEVNAAAVQVYERFLPGPVTVVSRGLGVVAPGVESEFGTLGVRIPDYDLVTQIVAALGHPITATSANGSDGKRPYQIVDIFDGLSPTQKNLLDLVLDAGELPHNPPSTVIDTTTSTPVTFRQGQIQVTAAGTATSYELDSTSEAETQAIAGKLLLKHWNTIKKTGLVVSLDGSLGVGKTIFAKGAANFLLIDEPITSPTYTYIEEYKFNRHGAQGMFYHLDLWKVSGPVELERLEIEKLLQPGSVVLIEWYSQVATWLEPLITAHKIPTIQIAISENTGVAGRRLAIHE